MRSSADMCDAGINALRAVDAAATVQCCGGRMRRAASVRRVARYCGAVHRRKRHQHHHQRDGDPPDLVMHCLRLHPDLVDPTHMIYYLCT